MNTHRHLSLAPLALGAGLICLAGSALAQQPAANAQPQQRITDARPSAELVNAPTVTIKNGQLTAKIFVPEARKGFYQGTRFDWAGMIGSLTYRGHDFYVPWFGGMS